MVEPCKASAPSNDPDLDLVADTNTLECLGTLRYMVYGLQEFAKRSAANPVIQSLGISH